MTQIFVPAVFDCSITVILHTSAHLNTQTASTGAEGTHLTSARVWLRPLPQRRHALLEWPRLRLHAGLHRVRRRVKRRQLKPAAKKTEMLRAEGAKRVAGDLEIEVGPSPSHCVASLK